MLCCSAADTRLTWEADRKEIGGACGVRRSFCHCVTVNSRRRVYSSTSEQPNVGLNVAERNCDYAQ